MIIDNYCPLRNINNIPFLPPTSRTMGGLFGHAHMDGQRNTPNQKKHNNISNGKSSS